MELHKILPHIQEAHTKLEYNSYHWNMIEELLVFLNTLNRDLVIPSYVIPSFAYETCRNTISLLNGFKNTNFIVESRIGKSTEAKAHIHYYYVKQLNNGLYFILHSDFEKIPHSKEREYDTKEFGIIMLSRNLLGNLFIYQKDGHLVCSPQHKENDYLEYEIEGNISIIKTDLERGYQRKNRGKPQIATFQSTHILTLQNRFQERFYIKE